ncbi:MAG: hypothetical protein V3T23_10270 [Nitrososphaerales archaeon]
MSRAPVIGRRSAIIIFWFAGLMAVPVIAYVCATFLGLITSVILMPMGNISEASSDVISFIVVGLSYLLAGWLYWWLWKQFKRGYVVGDVVD